MRIKIIVCIVLTLLIFSGASPWEGAAAAAPDGELPGTGRYVATNSFPRNTVVDITNIETNKSTRAIVANGLDSSGLLAIVSREAAEIIGMRPGSVIRIRMTQPSDPIAYLRFTEGLAAGIPEYDSGNVITEENYQKETDWSFNPEAERETQAVSRETPPQVRANTGSGTQGYVLEPEWGGRSTRNIIDLPEYSDKPEGTAYSDKQDTEKTAGYIPQKAGEDNEQLAEVTPREEAGEDNEQLAGVTPREETGGTEEYLSGLIQQEETGEDTEHLAGYIPQEEVDDVTEQLASSGEYLVEDTEYYLVPSQERPPQKGIYGIDPSDIIPGINAGISRASPEQEPVMESASFVTDNSLKVPRIYELDRGRYYVQIAALDTAESAESAINMIDQSYKPVVFKDGDNWYRILLGPLNQGESAAVLQRFRSIGYKDAFVRQGR